MSITSRIAEIGGLPAGTLDDMFALMRAHYRNVGRAAFERDLAAKDRAILLFDDGRLCGFSTQVLFAHDFRGEAVRVVFSGDTIVDQAHWKSLALPVAWGRMMLGLLREAPDTPLYWLLTSKGFRTYRFLPVFFREFVPRSDRDAPARERELLRHLAAARFGPRFDPGTGILAARPEDQHLRADLAVIPESRRSDPHVAFFERANPGHARGDELVCLCRFEEANLTDFILQRLRP